MKPIPKVLQVIAQGIGFLGQLVGIKPYGKNLPHIGPPHIYDAFDNCMRCPRIDRNRQGYTDPPCPRTRTFDPLG